MERHLIVLPDGTEIFSGNGTTNAIQSISHTSSVNKGTELTLGSVCSDMLEVKLFTPAKNLSITVGTEVTYYTVDDNGARKKIGMFRLETPERTTRNTYKFVAYDRVSWLDRDMTSWLNNLDGWPYDLLTFAQLVCNACMLTLTNVTIPNADFPVHKFKASKYTARDLLSWVGEICARFCRATPDGKIEFAWYKDSGLVLEPTGENYYSSGGLKYEDYQVEPIEAVQVQMASSEEGLLFPEVDEKANRYVINVNPLITFVNEDLLPYLHTIEEEISNVVYSPCRITLPSRTDIKAGDIIHIQDIDGYLIKTYVMTRSQKGQKITLESVGSPRRDSSTAIVNQGNMDLIVDAAIKRLNQTEIFNKLTNNGTVEGFFMGEDGQIYINATYLSSGILQSKDASTFFLDLDEGILKMNATELTIGDKSLAEAALKDLSQQGIIDVLTAQGAAKGIALVNGQLYLNASYINSGEFNADLITAGVLQSKDGETFKLDLDKGTFNMSGTGKFYAPNKKSYITVEGSNFSLYAKPNEYSDYSRVAVMGYVEDEEGKDYPLILLGNEESSENRLIGMFKMFDNGFYIGNSVPKWAVGEFKGMKGAVGMFIDITDNKNYIVEGETLKSSFTAVFG